MDSMSIFAERLKEIRTKRNLKQNELAQRVGVTPQTISAYEKGGAVSNGKNPTLENAVEIAKALNVSLDWLCGIETTKEGNMAKMSLGAVARMIVGMEYWDTVEFCNHESVDVFAEKGDDYYDVRTLELPTVHPAIVFKHGELRTFVLDWCKVKQIHNDGTIDKEFFDRWLEDRLQKLDNVSCDTQFPF